MSAISSSESTAEDQLLHELDKQLDSLCNKTDSGSILGSNSILPNELPSALYEELRKRAPLLFRVLLTASWSSSKARGCDEAQLALIYAILMRQRNQRFTAHAHVMTALCLRYHAGNQVNVISYVQCSKLRLVYCFLAKFR